MSELKINFSDYKASGIYFEEHDNTVIIPSTPVAQAQRILVGSGAGTVYNRPMYLGNMNDVESLVGPVDKKSERKGSFFERAVRTAVRKSPIFAINLLPVNTVDNDANTDIVGINAISFDATKNNLAGTTMFANMYNRSKFWIADDTALVNAVNGLKDDTGAVFNDRIHSPYFSIGNCGTKDISVIIRKAEGLTGYNVSFYDWYGSEDAIPYRFINKSDLVSDYFIQVIVVAGRWNESDYATLAVDPVWKEYFSTDGIKAEKVNKFLRLSSVNVLGNWTGCILPGFTDKQGKDQSIEYKINSVANRTGLLFGVNNEAIEALCGYTTVESATNMAAYNYYMDVDGDSSYGGTAAEDASFIIDMNGENLRFSTLAGEGVISDKKFMSYVITDDEQIGTIFLGTGVQTVVNNGVTDPVSFSMDSTSSFLGLGTSTAYNIQVGDYVRGENGRMCKVIKKRTSKDSSGNTVYTYTCSDAVNIFTYNTTASCVEIHKPFSDMYESLTFIPLTGLKLNNKHKPGYDADGNIDQEGGVEKIYAMLEDTGIQRGLLNNDMIDFRYVVDTMGYGLGSECGGKKYLSRLASKKQHCTALINLPSMTQFASSDNPFFGPTFDSESESRPTFDVSYIPMGGNDDMVYDGSTDFFSLPTVDNGSQNTAFFTPYFKYRDGSRTVLIPPATDISNVFMNKFTGGDPYKTVANTNGVVYNSSIDSLEYDFDETERGYLENFGVNPVIFHNGNILIYGDRTAYQDVNSDLNFLHVRELLNTIEIECRAVLDDFVFTYNNAVNRAEIVGRLNPILSAMQESGALTKYEIQVDSNNNVKEVIDNKFCLVDIGVWVTSNMEKIVTRITLNRGTDA